MEEDDEKILCLTEYELLKVLEEQVTTLLKACTNQKLPVPEFLTAFLRCHGHSIRLSDYGANSVVELIHKIPNAAQVQCTVVHWSGEMTLYSRHFENLFKTLTLLPLRVLLFCLWWNVFLPYSHMKFFLLQRASSVVFFLLTGVGYIMRSVIN